MAFDLFGGLFDFDGDGVTSPEEETMAFLLGEEWNKRGKEEEEEDGEQQ